MTTLISENIELPKQNTVTCLQYSSFHCCTLWQSSWLGSVVIRFLLCKCGSSLPHFMTIRFTELSNVAPGLFPFSHLRSEENKALTVANVAISCLTWQSGLETQQQNIFWPFSTKKHTLFAEAQNVRRRNLPLICKNKIKNVAFPEQWSTHPVNPSLRCWNAFENVCGNLGENNMRSCCKSCFILRRMTIKQRAMFFNRLHTAPDQQSHISELSTVETQGIVDSSEMAALTEPPFFFIW